MNNFPKLAQLALVVVALQAGTALARNNPATVHGQTAEPIQREQLRDGSRTARVSFADLDLAQVSGEAALKQRVRAAVAYVCEGPLPDGYFASDPKGGTLACAVDTRKVVQPQIDAVVAAARSGEGLAITMIGFKSR